MQDEPLGRRTRSDARINRDRILEAAMAELSRDPDVALSVIGKRAGVGQGTLYRNFPDRESLVLELYHREVDQIVEAAEGLLATQPPAVALRRWLTSLAEFAMAKAGLGGAMKRVSAKTGGSSRPGYGAVRNVVERLLEANRAVGAVRTDVAVDDLLLMIAGIWDLDAEGDWRERAEILFDVIMAGLAAGASADGAAAHGAAATGAAASGADDPSGGGGERA